MSNKAVIHTDLAPAAIGTYSQAVKAGNTIYMSGQIPLDPVSMTIVEGGFEAQAEQVFKNLSAVIKAAGAELSDVVKLNIYLTDLSNFPLVNEVMGRHFQQPYPARAAVGISELPKGSLIEVEGVAVLS
ncbi:reactive intermediate/imine deaminase [Oceanospirillum multiglobuliferum]|uniref:Reactive intermediate/imine deaminase n=1 Tax=Oceanospirillum multiglobuliferum TaxID=64969 RepID=A0A1T4NUZ9_9GAMM|nr:RidA family protein [Oceanospirillum multiglobuliferum]OPX55655.1 reactive intermediate/imine deaminase [Oceanospirillum multiglobuliferum]SJZ83074.1 reactive intermediate/imine deaminase [Oceanospirillum multiglobuliferum]